MFTKQTDGKFEKWVESGLSTFEFRRLVAEIYFTANLSLVTFICRRICDKKCHLILWRTNRTRLISFFQPYSYNTVYDTTNEEVCQTIPSQECRDAVKTEYRTVLDRQCVTEKEQQCSTVVDYVTENVCSQGNILMGTDNKIVRR